MQRRRRRGGAKPNVVLVHVQRCGREVRVGSGARAEMPVFHFVQRIYIIIELHGYSQYLTMQYGTSLNRYTHAWCAALGSSLPSLPLYFFFISFSNRSQAAHMKLFQHVSCISWLIAEEQALSFFIHVQPIYQPISNANTKSKQLKAIAYSNEKIEQFSFHFLYIMYLCIIRVVGHNIIYNSLIFFLLH